MARLALESADDDYSSIKEEAELGLRLEDQERGGGRWDFL